MSLFQNRKKGMILRDFWPQGKLDYSEDGSLRDDPV